MEEIKVDEKRLLEVYKKHDENVRRAKQRYHTTREERLKYAKDRAREIVESKRIGVVDRIKQMDRSELESILLSISVKHSQMLTNYINE
jgi:hypothetical protein